MISNLLGLGALGPKHEVRRLTDTLGDGSEHGPIRARIALLSILGLLGLHIAVRFRLGWNGPYMDESDYLFLGQRLFSGQGWPSKTYVFSSDLPFFLLGTGDRLGGLLGARAVNAALGLASLYFAAQIFRFLFANPKAIAFGTLLLALQASHIFQSRFATYDMPAFFFFCAGLYALARGIRLEKRSSTALAGVLLALATLSKYIVGAYLPLLAALVLVRKRDHLLAFIFPLALPLLAYGLAYRLPLQSLLETHVFSIHQGNAAPIQVLQTALPYLALPVALALGALMLGRKSGYSPSKQLILFLFATPLLAYHLHSQGMISMYKHLVYSQLFLVPLAGAFLAWLDRRSRLAVVGILLLQIGLAHRQLQAMEGGYLDPRPVVDYVQRLATPETTLLSEDPYLFRYYLSPEVPDHRLAEISRFTHGESSLGDPETLLSAIHGRRFDLIYLNGQVQPDLGPALAQAALEAGYLELYSSSAEISPVQSGSRHQTLQLFSKIIPKAGTVGKGAGTGR